MSDFDVFSGITVSNPTSDLSFPGAGSVALAAGAAVEFTDTLAPYSAQSTAGFLRFELTGGFGQTQYLNALMLFAVGLSNAPAQLTQITTQAKNAAADLDKIQNDASTLWSQADNVETEAATALNDLANSPQELTDLDALFAGILPIYTTADEVASAASDATTILGNIESSVTQATTATKPPVPPYTPTLQSFSLSYTAKTSASLTVTDETTFDQRTARFFHIYPFGDGEQHSLLSGNPKVYLLPQFTYATVAGDDVSATPPAAIVPNQGEFYLGLTGLSADRV